MKFYQPKINRSAIVTEQYHSKIIINKNECPQRVKLNINDVEFKEEC